MKTRHASVLAAAILAGAHAPAAYHSRPSPLCDELLVVVRPASFTADGEAAGTVPVKGAAFEDKAPHGPILRDIPVFVVTVSEPALAGLAALANGPENFGIDLRSRRFSA